MIFRFKVFLIFINILSLQNIFANSRSPATTCRSHFVQNDVLNIFTGAEKSSLETAALKLAKLIGNSNSDQLQTKEALDASMRKLLIEKKFNSGEVLIFTNWFKERIQFYIELKTEPQRTAALHAQIRKNQLEKQKKSVNRKISRLKNIFIKYKAENLSQALISAQRKKIEYEKTPFRDSIVKDILFILSHFEQLEKTREVFQIMVQYDYLPAVKYFIQQKVNWNPINKNIKTLLHLAAQYNPNPKIIEALLQSDYIAYVNAKNEQGKTALHLAAYTPYAEIVKILIEAGADPLLTDNNNSIALHSALQTRNMDASVVRALLQVSSAEQINFGIGFNRSTPLQLAVEAKNLDIVKALLEAGADPSIYGLSGSTALHFAAGSDSVEILKLLIEAHQGAQLHAKDDEGRIPLHFAAEINPNIEIVQTLIDAYNGTQLNLRDSYGNTVLHSAIFNTNPIVLKILLEAGVDPTLKNDENKTALDRLKTLFNMMDAEQTPSKKLRYQYKVELLHQAIQEWEKTHQ